MNPGSFLFGLFAMPIATSYAQSLLAGTERSNHYRGNAIDPNVMPEVSDVLRMMGLGVLSEVDANGYLSAQGVAMAISPEHMAELLQSYARSFEQQGESHDDAIAHATAFMDASAARGNPLWTSIADYAQPRLPVDFAVGAGLTGALSDRQVDIQLRMSGFTRDGLLKQWRVMHVYGDFATALQQWRLGAITDSQLDYARKAFGYSEQDLVDRRHITAPLPTAAAEQLWLDGRITERELRETWQSGGMVKPEFNTQLVQRLKDSQIPVLEDLLRSYQIGAWSPAVHGANPLYSEYPDAVDSVYPAGQQYDRQITVGAGVVPTGKISWSQLRWALHWQQLAPREAFELRARLRPDSVGEVNDRLKASYEAAGMAGDFSAAAIAVNWTPLKPFTQTDVTEALRVAGVRPDQRQEMIALSYPVIEMRQIHRLISAGLRDRDKIVKAMLNIGYDHVTAGELADAEIALAEKEDRKWIDELVTKARHQRVEQILATYSAGLIQPGVQTATFTGAPLEGGPQLVTPKQFAAAALQQQGLKPEEAELLIGNADVALAEKDWEVAHKTVLEAFAAGAVAPADLAAALIAIGVEPISAQLEANRLVVGHSFARRALSVSDVLKYQREGLIRPADAVQRLVNLGHSQPDVAIFEADVEHQERSLNAKLEKSTQASGREQAKALRSFQQETAKLLAQSQSLHRRVYSSGTLRTWLEKGVVSEARYRELMAASGYPAEYIEDEERQASLAKGSVFTFRGPTQDGNSPVSSETDRSG
jgi:hypothetical protein